MKLTTDLTVYDSVKKEQAKYIIDRLVDCVSKFCTMNNCAFCWSNDYIKGTVYAIEYFMGEATGCRRAKKVAELLPIFRKWMSELIDWCVDDSDALIGEDGKPHLKSLRVEIEDMELCGGLSLKCFDINDEEDHSIQFVRDLDENDKRMEEEYGK